MTDAISILDLCRDDFLVSYMFRCPWSVARDPPDPSSLFVQPTFLYSQIFRNLFSVEFPRNFLPVSDVSQTEAVCHLITLRSCVCHTDISPLQSMDIFRARRTSGVREGSGKAPESALLIGERVCGMLVGGRVDRKGKEKEMEGTRME